MANKVRINMPRVFLSPQDAGIVDDNGNIIGSCERAVGFRFASVTGEKTRTPIQEIGIAIHKSVTQRLRTHSNTLIIYGVDENIPVYGVLQGVAKPIFGFADTVVTGDILGYGIHADTYMPVEIKSFGIKSDSMINRSPWPRHIIQTAIYAALLKVDEALISYVSREDGKEVWWKIDISADTITAAKMYTTISGLDPVQAAIPTSISMSQIIDRYSYLVSCIANKKRIDEYKRDFYLLYPYQDLDLLYNTGKISKSQMQKAKSTGIIDCGDFECMACEYRHECWKV